MFGLKERHYTGRVLKIFWCDSDNKNFAFFRPIILEDISVLLIYRSELNTFFSAKIER